MTTHYTELQNTFNTLGIVFTTATLSNDNYKTTITLANVAVFVFDDMGTFVQYKALH